MCSLNCSAQLTPKRFNRIYMKATVLTKISIPKRYNLLKGSRNKAVLITKLITQQIGYTPEIVGKPINVVKITRGREFWFHGKNNCN